ncbi:MAG: hypothetical protein PVF87_13490, partial [Acidimicrobiia bacterium]
MPDKLIVPLMGFLASRVLAVTNPLGRKVRDAERDLDEGREHTDALGRFVALGLVSPDRRLVRGGS